jgi:hypothetical protein
LHSQVVLTILSGQFLYNMYFDSECEGEDVSFDPGHLPSFLQNVPSEPYSSAPIARSYFGRKGLGYDVAENQPQVPHLIADHQISFYHILALSYFQDNPQQEWAEGTTHNNPFL